MVRASPMQTNFTAGEWSPLMGGHIDLQQYVSSSALVENLICLKQGPMVRRGGTFFANEVKDSTKNTLLLPFEFSTDQSYHIEMGDLYFRFYTSGALITDGGSPYEVAHPYNEADLFNSNRAHNFQTAQSADVMYIAHGGYNTHSLARMGDTDWSVNSMEFVDGPYLDENTTEVTFTCSNNGVLTASDASAINFGEGFLATDVGRSIRIYNESTSEWFYTTVITFNSTTSVTVSPASGHLGATTRWRMGLFSETTGYPRVVTLFQDRVFLAGCDAYPDRWALTRQGGYSDTQFQNAPSDLDGLVTDDAGITGALQSGRVNIIQWAGVDDRGLIIGTTGREWIIRPSSNNEALTPSNAKADAFSALGSAYVQPIQAETGTVFAQKARRKLLDIIYSFERDQLSPRDLTIPNEHLTKTGIAQLQLQQEPINCIWMRLTNGDLRGVTYYPQEQVFAPHRHVIGGGGIVKSISTAPAPDGSRDELWLVVERTIDGVTKQYIEYMTRYFEDDIDKVDAIHVDSALTYDGAETGTLSGLNHLEGETVKLLVDGNSHPDLIVSGGAVTLANNRTGSVIQVGLSAPWRWQSQRFEAGSRDGVSQGKKKRLVSYVVRLLNTLGLYYGKSDTDGEYDEYTFNQGASYGESLPLFSGDTPDLLHPEGTDSDGDMYLWHDGVFPASILAIMPQVRTFDKG